MVWNYLDMSIVHIIYKDILFFSLYFLIWITGIFNYANNVCNRVDFYIIAYMHDNRHN